MGIASIVSKIKRDFVENRDFIPPST